MFHQFFTALLKWIWLFQVIPSWLFILPLSSVISKVQIKYYDNRKKGKRVTTSRRLGAKDEMSALQMGKFCHILLLVYVKNCKRTLSVILIKL